MRTAHRWTGTIILVFALWFALTGLATQAIDLAALLRHAPAADPDIMAIRESIDGPPNQIVIRPADYDASAFPAGFDFTGAISRVAAAGRASLSPRAPLEYVELRVVDRLAVGQVGSGPRVVRIAADDGRVLAAAPQARSGFQPSAHQTAKHLHRLFFLGDNMLWLNALVGIGLCAMIVTGLVLYARLLKARMRNGRRSPFWSAGGRWRALHRGVALVSAVFLLIIAASGVLLSIDSLAFGIYRWAYPERLVHGFSPIGTVGDYSSPLTDAQLQSMLGTTLRAFYAQSGARPIKVIRLRAFAGMPQGVIVAGGRETEQVIFNAASGARAGLSGPGYPYTGFPLGWQLHELVKKIHRGDVIGIPGRLMAAAAALSLAYLSISGLVMYLDLLGRRRRTGRHRLFWS